MGVGAESKDVCTLFFFFAILSLQGLAPSVVAGRKKEKQKEQVPLYLTSCCHKSVLIFTASLVGHSYPMCGSHPNVDSLVRALKFGKDLMGLLRGVLR